MTWIFHFEIGKEKKNLSHKNLGSKENATRSKIRRKKYLKRGVIEAQWPEIIAWKNEGKTWSWIATKIGSTAGTLQTKNAQKKKVINTPLSKP